jgi:signal transduction histidine kinase
VTIIPRPAGPPAPRRLRSTIGVLAAAYLVTGFFVFQLAVPALGVSGLWIPGGLALAAWVVLPPATRRWIPVGTALLTTVFYAVTWYGLASLVVQPVIIGVSNAVAGVLLVRGGGAPRLSRLAGVARLGLAATVSTFVALGLALLAVVVVPRLLATAGMGEGVPAPGMVALLNGFGSGIAGTVLGASLVMSWLDVDRTRWWALVRRRGAEALVLILVSAAVAWVLFLPPAPMAGSSVVHFTYTMYPFVVWCAWRFGPPAVTLQLLGFAVVALVAVSEGQGPIASDPRLRPDHALIATQILITVTWLVGTASAGLLWERDEAAEAASRAEAAYRAVLEAAPDTHVTVFGPDLKPLFAAGTLWPLAEPHDGGVPLPVLGAEREACWRRAFDGERLDRRAELERRVFQVSVMPLRGPDGAIFAGMQFAAEVTAFVRAEERLRQLAQGLESAREQERKRIAAELHDDLGQKLTGLRMDATWLQRRVEGELASRRLADMTELIDQTVDAVRRISSELRPGVLDDLGLGPAVEWLATSMARRAGLQATVSADGDFADLDEARATTVFRIAQEGLTNAIRHADAGRVTVELARVRGEVRLLVADDGRGGVRPEGRPGGLGLLGIRERVSHWGGTLTVESPAGGGTALRVAIPDGVKPA